MQNRPSAPDSTGMIRPRQRIPGHVDRVGIFGGTFDPVHHGHLLMAQEALEQLGLDRLLFIPAAVSPFKQDRVPGATADQRLAMIRLATAPEPRFVVDDRELRRGGPSYTVDTVRSLLEDHPGVRFILLIGSDQLPQLGQWRGITELKNLVDFAILTRGDDSSLIGASDFPRVIRRIDLSSTEIRNRLASGLSVRLMVPAEVYQYIMTEHPYRSDSFHGHA
jgi:nicotinate-nucleotide adenylyltransferase